MKGLPELQVLVHDTVSVTLRGIKGIVESHTRRFFEAEKMGIVENMVIHALTEEVIRVTTRSAEMLAKRELSALELNQKRLADSLNEAQREWQRRYDSLLEMHAHLDVRGRQHEAALEAVKDRVKSTEDGVAKLPGMMTNQANSAEKISNLVEALEAARGEVADLKQQLSGLEQTCEHRYVGKDDFKQASASLRDLGRQLDERGDDWIKGKLQGHVPRETLEQQLAELEAKMEEKLRAARTMTDRDMGKVQQAIAARHEEFARTCATHDMLSEARDSEGEQRSRLQVVLRQEAAAMRDEFAKQHELINQELEAQRVERANQASSFRESLGQVDEQSAGARVLVDTANQEIRRMFEDFNSLKTRIASLENSSARMEEGQSKLRTGFSEEKAKADMISQQQQHNRKELSFIMQRWNDMDTMRSDLTATQSDARSQANKIDMLQQAFSRLEFTVAAYKPAGRQEAPITPAQLQAEVERLREDIAQVRKEQAVSIVELRALHGTLLKD